MTLISKKLLDFFLFYLVFFIFKEGNGVLAGKKGNHGRENRQPSAVSDDMYDELVKLAKGEDLPPVAKRTKAQKTASVRFWRAKGGIELRNEGGTEILYHGGRRLVRLSDMNNVVADKFRRTKGSGERKLVHSLKYHFVGLSKEKVQHILNPDRIHYQQNAKFCNKATLKPIRARDVQIRHQVDLMGMGEEGKVQVGNKSYRYILSVLDVFSRFVWLKAIQTKHSFIIAAKLKEIYQEHGSPRVVQSDQGSEFKGAVTQLCRDMNIKTIYSRPYHPQSQGKVERSH